MKNWKRLLSTVLAAALFMTQPGGVTFAGAVSRGASAAADAVSTAAQYMAEALQNVMIPLPTGAVVRAAATYSIANDTAILKYDTSGVITGFEVTDPNVFDGHLEIPASIKDVTITSIAENAFSNNAELLSVVIPDSVTAIGDGAFSACFSLTAVDLPAGLTVLNNEMFRSCEKLNSISLPENLTAIGQGAFMYCSALTEISIPDNVTVIGNATFQGCTGLHTVNGGSGLQTIGRGAFSDCTALTNIILPNSLTVMGEQAFYLCSSLESIDIPNQLTEIPSNAFQGCTKLAIVDFGQVKCIGMRAFTETGLTQLELPNTVEQIGDSAFSECLNLSYAVLPDSVTQMGEYLFEKCSALENVQLPAGIKLIESATFLNCANLQSIQIPEGVDTIESDAFLGCTALTSVLLPSTLKAIEEDAFFRCTALKSVILPEGVATVGKRAFGNCFNLASVTVNGSTTSFGDNVLEGVAEDFTFWVLENSTALQYAVDNGINYRIIGSESEARTLSVTVQTPGGQTLSEGFSVNWYEAEETTPVAPNNTTLSNADPDKTYEFEIILEDSLLAQYEQPERQEIKPDDPASVTVTLTPVSVLTLTGEVEDSSGELLADVSVLVELETDEEGEPSHAGTTGEDGKFSLTIPALYAQVSLQKDGYYTKRIDIAPDAAEGGTYNLGVLQLTETVADRINLTLQASRAVPAGETAALQSISPDSSLQFSMTGADGQPITGFEMQGTALLFQPNEVEAKETITLSVTDRSGRYADAQAQVTLNEHKVGSAALVLQERGSFRLGTVSGENARVLVFGSDGTLKNRFIASSGLQGDPMPAGSYTLVYLQNSSLLPSVPTLARLDELGLRAGTDYVQQKAAIQDGVITVLEDVQVPALDTETLVRTQAAGTGLFSSTLTPDMQNPFYLQVNYLMQEGTGAQASTVQVCLPEGLALLESNNNVFVNGVISTYTENNDGTIEVPVSGTSASVIVYCYAEQAGSYDVSAYLTFTDEAVQPVGTVSLTASNATISVTDRTSSATIPVSGKAMPRAEVTIYDNGVQVGTATANAVGSWSTTIELQNTYDYSYHFVHAETRDTATNEALVIYDSQPSSPTPELQTITMRYVDTKPNVVTLDFQKNDTIVPNYYITFIDYIGSTVNDKTEYSFTFQVKFDRNDLLESVYVLTESASSDMTCIETTYDEATQTWVGVHVFDGSTAPVSVCAAYRLNDSAGRTLDESQAKDMAAELYEQMEQAASAVELEFDYTLFEDGSGFALLDDEGTPFLNYTVAEEADTRTADELVADGFYPIAEDEAGNYTVFSKAEYSDTVIQETYVDTMEHLQVTETMQMVQDQTTATSMLARIESIDVYDTMDNIVSWAGFIPGYGSLVDLTSGLVHLVGDQVMWRQTLKGNRFILNNKLDTLRAILESDCPDGSYRVPNTVYQQMISNISDIEAGIEQYGRQAETYINMSIGTFAMQQVLGSARGKVLKAGANAVLKRGVKNVQKYKALQQKYIKDKILGATRLEIADQWQSKVSDMAVTHLVDQNGGEFSINRFGLDVLTSYGIENYIHGQCASLEEWIDDCIAQVRASLRDCDTPPNDPSDYDHTTDNQDDYHHTTGNQSDYDYTTDKKTLRPVITYDPAGFVYEAVPSNRLEGVTATVHYQGTDGEPVEWDAADYDQINPQITGSSGMFAWFVPEGQWIVKYTKDGYKSTDSSGVAAAAGNTENPGWLPVPPPQFNVDVGMVSTVAPVVERAVAYTDRIEIAFSQYMDIESVQDAISLNRDGQPVTVTVTALDAEDTLDGSTQYATRFSVIPADGDCTGTITVSTGAKNYAATSLAEPHTAELTAPVQRPTGIAVSGQLGVVYRDATTVTLTLQPGIAGKTLEVKSLTPSLLSVAETTVTTGENGTAAVTLTGLLPGEGLIRVTEPESGLSETISVPIAMSADELTDAEKPAPVTATLSDGTPVTSGMTLESNTQITLSTTTPNAEIRYTLDDTCPCKEDALRYEGPITITKDTVLRAAALLDGVYSDTIRLELTVANGTEEPDNPDDPGGSGGNSGGSSSGGGSGSVTTDNRPSVSAGEGGTVTAGDGTVTITPDEGYQIGSVAVNGEKVEIPTDGILTGLDADDEVTVAFERITDDTGLPFADVAPASWYHDAVQYVYENGMMNGTSDTLFSPNATVTRAMIVTILHRLENAPASAASGFTDVAAGMYYADAVDWAAANGIVNGVSETRFAPDDPIIREQLAAILYRYAQFKGYAVTASADLSAYTDAAQISAYATTAMQWANENGLITGNTGTTLNPKGHATRAEAATILMRFCQDIAV